MKKINSVLPKNNSICSLITKSISILSCGKTSKQAKIIVKSNVLIYPKHVSEFYTYFNFSKLVLILFLLYIKIYLHWYPSQALIL